jgi:hypothetical protein
LSGFSLGHFNASLLAYMGRSYKSGCSISACFVDHRRGSFRIRTIDIFAPMSSCPILSPRSHEVLRCHPSKNLAGLYLRAHYVSSAPPTRHGAAMTFPRDTEKQVRWLHRFPLVDGSRHATEKCQTLFPKPAICQKETNCASPETRHVVCLRETSNPKQTARTACWEGRTD